MPDLEALEAFGRAAGDLSFRQAPQPEPGGHVLEDRRVEEQRLLKDHRDAPPVRQRGGARRDPLAAEEQLPRIGLLDPREPEQQRALARTVRPDQRERLARRDREVRQVEHVPAALADADAADFENRRPRAHRGRSACWMRVSR